MTAYAVSGGVPLLLYIRVIWPLRRRPASLHIDSNGSRFVVPASPHYAALWAIVLMWAAAGLVMTERVPYGDHMRVAEFPGTIPASVTAVTLSIALAAVVLFVNRPSVTLKPTGLTIRRLRRQSEISWDDLAPGGPPPPAKRTSQITLYLKRPRPGTVLPASETMPIGRLHLNPEFLTAAIRHYVEQPEQRNAIGTEAELTRLRSGLAA